MTVVTRVRLAAIVGVLFSGLAVTAGTRVLTQVDGPDYVVLPWLVWYNVTAGVCGVAIGAGLWFRRRWAITTSSALAAAHGIVLIVLLARRTGGWAVADDSLVAMTLRTIVWSAIAWVARRATR